MTGLTALSAVIGGGTVLVQLEQHIELKGRLDRWWFILRGIVAGLLAMSISGVMQGISWDVYLFRHVSLPLWLEEVVAALVNGAVVGIGSFLSLWLAWWSTEGSERAGGCSSAGRGLGIVEGWVFVRLLAVGGPWVWFAFWSHGVDAEPLSVWMGAWADRFVAESALECIRCASVLRDGSDLFFHMRKTDEGARPRTRLRSLDSRHIRANTLLLLAFITVFGAHLISVSYSLFLSLFLDREERLTPEILASPFSPLLLQHNTREKHYAWDAQVTDAQVAIRAMLLFGPIVLAICISMALRVYLVPYAMSVLLQPSASQNTSKSKRKKE